TTPEADRVLNANGTVIVPDILANAGGVIVSYLEWVQNVQAFAWTESEIERKLRDLMESAYGEVKSVAAERGLTLREAAHVIGVGRVAEAHRMRGLYPEEPPPVTTRLPRPGPGPLPASRLGTPARRRSQRRAVPAERRWASG